MNAETQINQWGQIVAEAWQNERFKNRLLAEPETVLKERGLDVPAGIQLRVVENTDQVVYLTLPTKPLKGELSDAELEGVAGGSLRLVGEAVNRIVEAVSDQLTRAAIKANIANSKQPSSTGSSGDSGWGDDGRE